MRQKILSRWFELQQGLWFIPSLMTLGGAILAFLMIRVDQHVLADSDIQSRWFFESGAEGARGVLTAIAATMITVATTVFSITIVALQLASSQFSPRVLRGFTRDRGNQLVLGMFIATFVYALLVLRTVQSESADLKLFVPAASVSLAMVFAIAAIGSLIYFFHHSTRSIQASVVIDRAGADTLALIDARRTHDADTGTIVVPEMLERGDLIAVTADRSGYITAIDLGALLGVARSFDGVVTVASSVGQHMLTSTALVQIPSVSLEGLTETDRADVDQRIRRAFTIDIERTLEHDVLLGFRQLSDIAIKALSPGINDPTTATMCIDRLGEALLQAIELRTEVVFYPNPHDRGGVRLRSVGFSQIVDESVPQIRHFAADDVVVVRHLLKVLEAVARDADHETFEILARQARLCEQEAMATLIVENDRQAVTAAASWVERDRR